MDEKILKLAKNEYENAFALNENNNPIISPQLVSHYVRCVWLIQNQKYAEAFNLLSDMLTEMAEHDNTSEELFEASIYFWMGLVRYYQNDNKYDNKIHINFAKASQKSNRFISINRVS